MNQLATWEMVVLGILVVLLLLWFFPGIKQMLAQSREAEKDWKGLLLPLGAVILFVLLLISLV